MGNRGKAFRRYQWKRAVARAKRFLAMCGLKPTPKQVHLYAKHRTPCSCRLCRGEKYRDKRDRQKKRLDNE